MAAATCNWQIELNSTLNQSWEFSTDSGPLNMTDYHAVLEIRPTPMSDTLLFQASDTKGNLVITALTGTLTVTDAVDEIGAIDISLLPDGKAPIEGSDNIPIFTACGKRAYYAINLEDADGVVLRAVQGVVIFSPWVVQP